jgi:hypothetical protein
MRNINIPRAMSDKPVQSLPGGVIYIYISSIYV